MTRLHHAIAGHTQAGRGPRIRRTSLFASTGLAGFVVAGLAASLSFGTPVQAQVLPTGGTVTAGGATITTGPGR